MRVNLKTAIAAPEGDFPAGPADLSDKLARELVAAGAAESLEREEARTQPPETAEHAAAPKRKAKKKARR